MVREGEDVQLRIIKIDPQRHRLGLSLRQAEEGDYAYAGGGGFEAWSGGSSYSLGGSTATAVQERDEDVEEAAMDDAETLPIEPDEPPEHEADLGGNGTGRVAEN